MEIYETTTYVTTLMRFFYYSETSGKNIDFVEMHAQFFINSQSPKGFRGVLSEKGNALNCIHK